MHSLYGWPYQELDFWEFSSPWKAIGWSDLQSGAIRRSMKKDIRHCKDFMQLEVEECLAGGWETVYKNWDPAGSTEWYDFFYCLWRIRLVGAGTIIVLFLILIWRFFVIATHAPDLFGALIAVGAMAHMMIQVILNIAVVTNSIPNTGITLPFISYGSSSLISIFIGMGLVLNAGLQRVPRHYWSKEGYRYDNRTNRTWCKEETDAEFLYRLQRYFKASIH
mgnify:CR=1 FL=1